METNNEMMDQRLVRLNEIVGTKLSAVSKSKRNAVKAEKLAAKYLIENWDNVEMLEAFVNDNELYEQAPESHAIAMQRLDQLKPQPVAEEEAKKIEETNSDPIQAETKAETTLPSTSADNTNKSKSTDKKSAGKPSKHQVGDIHPNGKWVWTEYKPGKFDWRGIPKKEKSNVNNMIKKSQEPKEEVKTFTMADWEAKKSTKVKLSTSQEKVKKLFSKGYRLMEINNGLFLSNIGAGGTNRVATTQEIVSTMFAKYNMTIPTDAYYTENA